LDIKRSGSQPSGKGPAEYFTGTVRIDPLVEAPDQHLNGKVVDWMEKVSNEQYEAR